jgi:hypothetical protein
MLIRDMRCATGLFSVLGVALFAGAFRFGAENPPDLKSRPVANWSPSDGLLAPIKPLTPQSPSFAEAVARPLFRKSRRPFDPSKVPLVQPTPAPVVAMPQPEAPAPQTMQLSVKGIVLSGSAQLALVASPELPDGQWLAKGSEINGWRIMEIRNEEVSIASAGNSVTLKLYVDNEPN